MRLCRSFALTALLLLITVVSQVVIAQSSTTHRATPRRTQARSLQPSNIPSAISTEAAIAPSFGGLYAAPYYPTGGEDTIATLTADFNHDGKPDIAVVTAFAEVELLLNNGAGGFQSPIISSYSDIQDLSQFNSATAADLNGDGYPDIVVGLDIFKSQSATPIVGQPVTPLIGVMLNQKDGSFAQPFFLKPPDLNTSTISSIFAFSFGIAQTTSSGHQDIVAFEQYSPTNNHLNVDTLIQTFVNNGSGSFQAKPLQTITASMQPSPGAALTPVFTDINHDGKIDLLLERDPGSDADLNDYIYVMLGKGDGTFELPTPNSTIKIPDSHAEAQDTYPYSVVIARNLTSDTSNADLILNTAQGIYEVLSNGNGTFQQPRFVMSSNGVGQILVADFNGDGKNDLITTDAGNFSTYLGNGDGTFSGVKSAGVAYDEYFQSPLSRSVLADFNGDGKLDLANNSWNAVQLALGRGDGTFEATPILFSPQSPAIPPTGFQALVAPDLNGDGRPDLIAVFANSIISAVTNGKGGFTYKTALPVAYYIFGAVGDFNGDGKQDVVLSPYNGNPAVALSNGDGTLKTPTHFINPPTPLACSLNDPVAGDINGDGKLDLIFPYSGDQSCLSSTTTVGPGFLTALGNGDGTFKPAIFTPTTLFPNYLALGRFHGNQQPLDMIVQSYNPQDRTNSLQIMQGKGNGTFDAPVSLTSDYQISQILTDDYNQDGKPDLTIIGYNSVNATEGGFLFAGNGNGTFAPPTPLAVKSSVTLGYYTGLYTDVNGDGIPDLIGNWQYGFLSVYLGTGKGVFATPVNYFYDGFASFIAAGKFLGDNANSVAVTTDQGGTALFMNQGGSTLTTKASATTIPSGKAITLSTTLSPTLTGQPTPTGTITFLDGTTELGTTSVDGTLSTAKLAIGTHTITAKYSGDQHFNPNTAAVITLHVTAAPILTLAISPTTLAFPATTVGKTSAAQQITFKNTGNINVSLDAFSFTGTNPKAFLLSAKTCGSQLPPATTCTVSLEFKPTLPGTETATFNAVDNATGSPQLITLKGTAAAPILTLAISPTTLAFPATTVGKTSAAQQITFKNTGNINVSLDAFSFTGTNPKAFLLSAKTCGSQLTPAATCTVSLEFKPTLPGTQTATFNAVDNATGSPQLITLKGSAASAQ